ncbi:MAG: TRC40/GET3/ArsA family transport-energizing ATPase [Firmicutes bacterium]|nr:TRC40/GET3/ArsA family transport-energizing ATPase [Bacillota bacterium]
MRYLFFSGKGGVGKTSLASSTAVMLADAGQRVLLVTTDPASNLADVFEQTIGPEPIAISQVPGLRAQEIDAEASAAAYRERALGPLRGVLPDSMISTLAEQMSGPCTVEIAGFDEFVHAMFLADYDVIVFDTAPTGHTLRLLALPSAWSVHITESEQGSGQTCIGPVEQLQTSKGEYEAALGLLQDPSKTTFILVTQPERAAVKETVRAAKELDELSIVKPQIVVNGVIPEEASNHPFFASRRRMQLRALDGLVQEFNVKPIQVPLLENEVKGIKALRALGKWVSDDVCAVR